MNKQEESNNVILFPKSNSDKSKRYLTKEEVDENIRFNQLYHIEESVENIAPIIFENLDRLGFHICPEDEDSIKDGTFIIETIRAIIAKHYGIYHPIQNVIDKIFEVGKDEEFGEYLKIVNKLDLNHLTDDDEDTERNSNNINISN